jgi:hypothetical protein
MFQPVLGDGGIAAERLLRGVEVEGLDEFADAEQCRCPGLVVAAELMPDQRADIGRASRGEHRIEFALGLLGQLEKAS